MELTGVQKLARVLRVIVIIVFVCNIVALLAVPYLVLQSWWGVSVLPEELSFLFGLPPQYYVYIPFWFLKRFLVAGLAVWGEAYNVVLTLFLWACGVCTAVILWQAKRVLDTILEAETFTLGNAANLKRAAVCCFVISGAALVRTVWGLIYYQSIEALLTYNFLFVPLFLVAGLGCMVMSALFRQAAELKAENDLTI